MTRLASHRNDRVNLAVRPNPNGSAAIRAWDKKAARVAAGGGPSASAYPSLEPLIAGRINVPLIRVCPVSWRKLTKQRNQALSKTLAPPHRMKPRPFSRELCAELGVKCEVRPVPAKELREADEVFITSTAGGVMGVTRRCQMAYSAARYELGQTGCCGVNDIRRAQ